MIENSSELTSVRFNRGWNKTCSKWNIFCSKLSVFKSSNNWLSIYYTVGFSTGGTTKTLDNLMIIKGFLILYKI